MTQSALIDTAMPVAALPMVEPEEFSLGTVLSASPFEEDHEALERIVSTFHFKVTRATTLYWAVSALECSRVSVVICERDLGGASWRDLLEVAIRSPRPPSVIVASSLADDALWMDALTAGAYDVLAKPFHLRDVIRAISLASRFSFDRQHGLLAGQPQRPWIDQSNSKFR
jgi:DNA-binding response OmpR family regulator